MNNDFSTLQDKWKKNKSQIQLSALSIEGMKQRIKHREKENFSFYYGTLITLSVTLIGIFLFFMYIAPIQEVLSKMGWYVMILGLLLRIIIELVSISKAKKMHKIDTTLDTLENTIEFHRLRKKIHNIISPIILVMYTIGFFVMTPELSTYMPFWNLFFICASYFIAGIIIFFLIRKGVKNEIKKIKEILALQKELNEQ